MNFVIDTSALVALSGIGRLDLLRGCCVCVGVPQAVRFELCDQGQGWTEASAAQAEILSGSWLKTVSVARSPTYGMLRTQVGAGETECIEFARTAKLTAILDDHDARKEAMRLGIPLVGSLGILLKSKELGLIDWVLPLIEGIQKNGIFLSNSLIENVLKSAGEAS